MLKADVSWGLEKWRDKCGSAVRDVLCRPLMVEFNSSYSSWWKLGVFVICCLNVAWRKVVRGKEVVL